MMTFMAAVSVFGLYISVTTGSSVICPDSYTDIGAYCYKFISEVTLAWADARDYCEQQDGHLLVESSPEEHKVFVTYRNGLPQQGDPLWVGIYVEKEGGYSWLNDVGWSDPMFLNWENGRTPQAPLGNCVSTDEVNNTQVWRSRSCQNPLSFVCETVGTSKPDTNDDNGIVYNTSRYLHNWKKVYPECTYTQSSLVVNANMARIHSLVSCAIMCSTVSGCAAFNHRRSDNTCQYILSQVKNDTSVSAQTGWDVWVDFPPEV